MKDRTIHRTIMAVVSLITLIPAVVIAQSPMTLDQAITEGQAFGNAQPQGKDAANAIINDAQTQGVPGLTPQAQSGAQAQGHF